jgi:hypothetical protein
MFQAPTLTQLLTSLLRPGDIRAALVWAFISPGGGLLAALAGTQTGAFRARTRFVVSSSALQAPPPTPWVELSYGPGLHIAPLFRVLSPSGMYLFGPSE